MIDAEDAGAEPARIKAELFGKFSDELPDGTRSTRYRDARAAALRLRDGGYRALAAP